MHWIMSFAGSFKGLTKNSSSLPWLKIPFQNVEKMQTEKEFPTEVRAFRFAMLKLLRDHVKEMESFEDFHNFLESCSSKRVLFSKHWVVHFMRSIMLILIYIRPKPEGDFAYHLYACHKMMPYLQPAKLIMFAMDMLLTNHAQVSRKHSG